MDTLIRYKLIVWVLIALLATCFVESLGTSCATKVYIITGKVGFQECCDCADIEPIENATVFDFLGDDTKGAIGTSLEKGDFEIPYFFDTYIGGVLLDGRNQCGRKPTELTIIVHAEGYFPIRKKTIILSPAKKGKKEIFEISPITMQRISEAEIENRNIVINELNKI